MSGTDEFVLLSLGLGSKGEAADTTSTQPSEKCRVYSYKSGVKKTAHWQGHTFVVTDLYLQFPVLIGAMQHNDSAITTVMPA